MLPTNTFITPESQGGVLKGSFEVHQTKGNQVTVKPDGGRGDKGVEYEALKRMGFLLSASLFEKFDVIWSHTGGAPSMLGGKFQFLGEPKEAKAAGHKGALVLGIGGNESEDENGVMDFELQGRTAMGIYGYRFTDFLMPYVNLTFGNYKFEGIFHKGALAGSRPEYTTNILGLTGGLELSYEIVFFKLELTYQQLKSSKSSMETLMSSGFSVGLSW